MRIILPLAACTVLLVLCSCEWSRAKEELSAVESNYWGWGWGVIPDAVWEKKKNLKVRYLIKDNNCLYETGKKHLSSA